jgi:hypothetical protein
MTPKEAVLRAIASFELPQGRFKNGRFFVSLCIVDDNQIGIDIRYFVEEDADLTPTPIGFRLPQSGVTPLLNALTDDPRLIGDVICIEHPNRRFHIRYLNDKYGESVDYRWYQTTEKYEGWTKKGFRVPTSVYSEFRQLLTESDLLSFDLSSRPDLFEGKNIVSKSKEPKGSQNKKRESANALPFARKPYVNEVLEELLNL